MRNHEKNNKSMDLDKSHKAVLAMESIEAEGCLPGRKREEKVTGKMGGWVQNMLSG
jgi:hypothetical protein